MSDEARVAHLEQRVAFLESALTRLLALVLHPESGHKGKAKAKDVASTLGSRRIIERALDAALIDLLERVELSPTETMAMPDPKLLRRLSSEPDEPGGPSG